MAYVMAKVKYGLAERNRHGLGALNCPGDPGCPGYVAPVSEDYTYTGSSPTYQAPNFPAQSSVTDWLNANAKTVGIGAAVFLGLALFMGRR